MRASALLSLFLILSPDGPLSAAGPFYNPALNPAISFNGLFLLDAGVDARHGSTGIDEEGVLVHRPGEAHSFGLQEGEIRVSAAADPFWELHAFLVSDGGEGLEIEEAYALNHSLPGISLKAGRMKAGFGKHALLHTHQFPFVAASLVNAAVLGEEGYVDAGLEASWLAPLPWFAELTAGVFRGTGPEEGKEHGHEKEEDGHGHAAGLDLSGSRADDFAYLARARSFHEIAGGATLEGGGSLLAGRDPNGRVQGAFGFDLTLKRAPARTSPGAFTLQGEWMRRFVRERGKNEPLEEGFYALGQYKFSRSGWVGIRFDNLIRTEIEEGEIIPKDEDGDDVQDVNADGEPLWEFEEAFVDSHRRVSANLTWAPSEFSAVRLEYAYGWRNFGADKVLDRRIALQLNQTIGSHPAHAY